MHTQSPLSLAISRAAAQAEVRRLDMSRTMDRRRIAQLLVAQAENLRLSPLGSDQLLAMALEAAASPGDFDAPELDALRQPASPLEQIQLRQDVFLDHDAKIGRTVARTAPDWVIGRRRRLSKHDPEAMAGDLRREADLNAALWDHPALPAGPRLRGLMLACIAPLREKAALIARGAKPRAGAAPKAPA